jgi:hypothetical protein
MNTVSILSSKETHYLCTFYPILTGKCLGKREPLFLPIFFNSICKREPLFVPICERPIIQYSKNWTFDIIKKLEFQNNILIFSNFMKAYKLEFIFLTFLTWWQYFIFIKLELLFSNFLKSNILSTPVISCLHVLTIYVDFGILSSCLIFTCITGVFLVFVFQLFLCCLVYFLSCLIVTWVTGYFCLLVLTIYVYVRYLVVSRMSQKCNDISCLHVSIVYEYLGLLSVFPGSYLNHKDISYL